MPASPRHHAPRATSAFPRGGELDLETPGVPHSPSTTMGPPACPRVGDHKALSAGAFDPSHAAASAPLGGQESLNGFARDPPHAGTASPPLPAQEAPSAAACEAPQAAAVAPPLADHEATELPQRGAQVWEPAARRGVKQRGTDRPCECSGRGGAGPAGQEGGRESKEEGRAGRSQRGERGVFGGPRISPSSSASSDDEGRERGAVRRASAARARANSSGSLHENLLNAGGEPAVHYGPGCAVAAGSAGRAAEKPLHRGQKPPVPSALCGVPRGARATSCTILLLLLAILVLRLALERGTLAGIALDGTSRVPRSSARALEITDRDASLAGIALDGLSAGVVHRYAAGAPQDEGPGSPSFSGALEGAGRTGQQLADEVAEAGAGAEGSGGGGGRAGDAPQGGASEGSQEGDDSRKRKAGMGAQSFESGVRIQREETGVGARGGAVGGEVRPGAEAASAEAAAAASRAQPQNEGFPADAEGAAQGAVNLIGGATASSAVSGGSSHGAPGPRYVWAPREGKFLLLFCIRGQISNRMICIRNHVIAAALLNRTLIAPLVLPPALTRNPRQELLPEWRRTPREPGYYTSIVWDIGRTRACLGPTTVITDKEYYRALYYKAQRRPLLVDAIHCWSGPRETCGNSSDASHVHNCPWSFGDPVKHFIKHRRAARAPPPPLEEPRVSQWHLPRDSYLAPLVYPDLVDAAGTGLGPRGSDPSAPASSASGLKLPSAAEAASAAQAGGGQYRPPGPRLQSACLARSMSSQDFVAALGGVQDPVLVLGDMVNVNFSDNPRILPDPASRHTVAGSNLDPLTVSSTGTGEAHAEGVPLAALFSRRGRQRRLLEEASASDPHEDPGPYLAKDTVGASRRSGSGTPVVRWQDVCKDPLDLLPAEELIRVSREAKNALLGHAAHYLGVHWRRGDFGVYCFFHSPYRDACFYSPGQAGKCAFQVANRLGLKGIFLATNAPEHEVEGFKGKLGTLSGGQLRVVQLPTSVTRGIHKDLWYTLLRRGQVAGSPQGANASGIPSWESQLSLIGLTLEKLIAARSQVFLGSVESTFTHGILQMRKSFATQSSKDSYVCFKELEWSVFDGLPKDLIREKKRRLKYSALKEKHRRLWEARERLRRRQERRKKGRSRDTSLDLPW